MVAGGHDKSRMKQAMINRKADINAGETVVANSFGTNHPRGPSGPVDKKPIESNDMLVKA